jgi:triosephosphate isomerase|tara:strand:+ start:1742 stop:2485 length:744 start_codon:yes stop_codon:yes gene_type:complete
MFKSLIVGNWKMHGTAETAANLASQLAEQWNASDSVEMIIFPPFIHIPAVATVVAGSAVSIGAQNVSEYSAGAYTGETSAEMLVDQGCKYVIVGHSERRAMLNESSETVAEKFIAAQNAGLIPIFCVGESLQQRQDNQTVEVVSGQIAAVVDRAGLQNVCRAVIAYEPVWAVGTGETATPDQAQQVHSAIRAQLGEAGKSTPLLYGGSVKAANAAELFAQPDINGGLVGGASLEANEFLNIAKLIEA